jgi:tetratricopeptide (TPR) repeat protein
LNEIILKACAEHPKDRYATAKEMLADLALLQSGRSVRERRARGRRWKLARNLVLTAIVLMLLGGGVFVLKGFRTADLRSANPQVNILVAQGNLCLLSETAERQSQGSNYFKQAIGLDPNCAQAWFGLFMVYDNDAESRRAIAKKLMQIAPSFAGSHYAAARVKWLDWQIRDALREARAATKAAGSKEDLGMAHQMLGFFLLQTDKPVEALKEYQRAERLMPSNPDLESHLGHPYFVQRRFEEAMAQYKSAEALEPRHLLCHRMMAWIYEARGDLMKAIDEYEKGDRSEDARTKRYYEQLREAARRGGVDGYYRRQLELELMKPKPDSYWVASYYAALGEKKQADKWLEQALAEHHWALTDDLMVALCWDHQDERFRAVARKVGLIE